MFISDSVILMTISWRYFDERYFGECSVLACAYVCVCLYCLYTYLLLRFKGFSIIYLSFLP